MNNNLPALMGLRFILSLWILVNHLYFIISDFFGFGSFVISLSNGAYYAVDIFFMLSGIVISHHYADTLRNASWRTYASFLWLRIARLYPVHIVTLLSVLVMVTAIQFTHYTLTQPQTFTARSFVENLFLVQAWHYDFNMSWNHFAWSISAEWLAYLVSPLIFGILYRLQSPFYYVVLYIVLLTIIPVFQMLGLFENGYASPVFRVLAGFGAGACLYRLKDKILPSYFVFCFSFLLFLQIFCIETLLANRILGVALYPVGLWLVYLAYPMKDRVGSWLRKPWMQYGGDLAYALYMVQFVIIMPIKKLIPHAQYNQSAWYIQMLYLLCLVTTVFAATILCHHLIEKPARHYLRQRNPFTR